MEKPFSIKFDDAPAAVKTAKKYNTHLYFAYHAAFNPLTLQAKAQVNQLLAKGDKITAFKVTFMEDVRNYHGANSWIFDPAIAGGGCLIDSGVNAMSLIHNVGVGFVIPVDVKLGFAKDFPVETSAHVTWTSRDKFPIKGELIQNWLHTGPEQREITITFKSGNLITFDYAKGTLISKINGKEHIETIQLRESNDILPTPMAYEYRNIIDDAVIQFEKKELIDPIGVAPFESIMLCYDIHNKKKSKL